MTSCWVKHATADAWVAPDGRFKWRFKSNQNSFWPTVTEATADNTGAQVAKASMTVQADTLTITVDDTVVENVWLQKGAIVRANRVVFRNCWVNENPVTSGNQIGIEAINPQYTHTLIERCTFIPANPNVMCYAIIGANVTTHRCLVIGGWTDCLNWQTGVNNDETLSGGCTAIGDFYTPTVYASDPHQKDANGNPGAESHSDCIQIANGGDHLVIGCTLHAIVGPADGYNYSHGMVVGPYAVGAIRSLTVIGCKFVGGGAQLSVWPNAKTDKSPYVPNLKVLYCKFDARGCDSDVKSGIAIPHSILVTPATDKGATYIGNVQIYPCSSTSGTPYGNTATPDNPVPAKPFVVANG